LPAAEIDKPIFILTLDLDDGVAAGDFVAGQRKLIGRRTPDGAKAADDGSLSAGVFEPSRFFGDNGGNSPNLVRPA